jgi:protein-S-isoprenylcysteine O-methyltransferase Ste14
VLLIIASGLIYIVVLGALQVIVHGITKARHIKRREPPISMLLRGVTGAGVPLVAITMRDDDPTAHADWRWTGVVLTVLGMSLTVWSQYRLGKSWVGGIGLHDKHKLVTTGPYAYVRHPLYSGMYVSAIGLGLITFNIWYGLCWIAFASALAIRIFGEEQLLREKFGKTYEEYRRTTGALFPKFW